MKSFFLPEEIIFCFRKKKKLILLKFNRKKYREIMNKKGINKVMIYFLLRKRKKFLN
jgi:hypothetical protein